MREGLRVQESFFTRAEGIALVASGWAMWAGMPASARRSANQPQPNVASKATFSGWWSSSPNTRSSSSGRVATLRLRIAA